MRIHSLARVLALTAFGSIAFAACAPKQVAVVPPPPPPPPPGAVAGSVAADRDGDGMVDGYYSSDGIYHANYVPPPPPPPPLPTRKGERG